MQLRQLVFLHFNAYFGSALTTIYILDYNKSIQQLLKTVNLTVFINLQKLHFQSKP